MSFQRTSHHRPRTSPITIPNKDLHKTIRHQVVIANRKRSRHTRRPNNCIRFVRAANTKATGLTGGYGCLGGMSLCHGPYILGAPGNSGRVRFRVMLSTQRCGGQIIPKLNPLHYYYELFPEFMAIHVRYLSNNFTSIWT